MKNTLFGILFFSLFLGGCIFRPPDSIEVKEVTKKEEIKEQIAVEIEHDLVDSRVQRVLSLAYAQLGAPYIYGGDSIDGFDCSGFVSYVYKSSIGKKLPRTSKEQSKYGIRVDRFELIPGDLVFFDTAKRGYINHSGIYLGHGKFIHASSSKRAKSVIISNIDRGFYKKSFRWGQRVD